MNILDRPAIITLVWLLAGVTITLAAISAGLALANGFDLQSVDYMLFVVASATVGGLISAHQPRHLVGWLLAVGAACFALMEFSGQYAVYGLVTEPGSLPLVRAIAWPQTWLWAPASALIFLLLPLYFPNGRLHSARWRYVAAAVVVATLFASIVASMLPGDQSIQVRTEQGIVENPLGVQALADAATVLNTVMPLAGFSLLLSVVAGVIVRYRASSGAEPRQIKWLTFAIASMPVIILLDRLINPVQVPAVLSLMSIPVAIGIAVLRYDLYDIDLIINRALVYGALTAIVIGVYVLIVGYVGSRVVSEDNLLLSVAATGIVAVLFQPVRERVQRAVNRLMYGERDEPYAVITRLGQRIEDTLTPDAVLSAIVETVAQALKVPYAAIALSDQSPAIAAATGNPVGAPVHLPLVYRNEPVGELILAPRRPGESFSAADRRLLDDLTRQAGIAAHAVRLSTELQHSRERLVTAREEERRRLRRDLHDGLGPALASMTLQAEAARDLLSANPQYADELLTDLTAGLQEATADIRRLVYGLRPPALDDLGLLPALRNHAARFGPQGPAVEIIADELFPSLPAAVEVAAYRIVQEALTNVMHHAQATRCTVSIRVTPDHLILDITDNGVGLSANREGGVGLRSMRERAEELGGSCTIEALPAGGTCVAATLPLYLEEQKP